MAAQPAVTQVTRDLYEALPELYRDADAAQAAGPSNYPLLRFLAGIFDQLQAAVNIVDRVEFVPLDELAATLADPRFGVGLPWSRPTIGGTYGSGTYGSGAYGPNVNTEPIIENGSDLVTANDADAAWLLWLAQLLGVDLPDNATVPEQRALLADPAATWAHGAPPAIRAAAEAVLPPGTIVNVIAHYGGPVFTIGVTSDADPGQQTKTWAGLKSVAPTWVALEDIGSFGTSANSATTALTVVAAVEKERPAGFQVVYATV